LLLLLLLTSVAGKRANASWVPAGIKGMRAEVNSPELWRTSQASRVARAIHELARATRPAYVEDEIHVDAA